MNEHISDLFFISDNYEAWDNEIGEWSWPKLLEYASETLSHLDALGVSDLPTPEQLAEDFINRV